jgi:hypothetical protein
MATIATASLIAVNRMEILPNRCSMRTTMVWRI